MVQLRASLVVLFVACLAVRTAAAGPNPHYGQVACTACHIDEEDYELRNEDPTALCNSCHGKDSHTRDHHPLRHAVPGIDMPDDWPLYEGMMTCRTCHAPSHEENIGLYMFLRGESDGGEGFCFNCHRREAGSDLFMLRDSMNLDNCPGCHRKEGGVAGWTA
jgi:hypothetical protein